ncbi:hypothetical protein DEJ43_10240 [Streptomyces venezuelae ATCC 10712]|nr:hypothetical protein DEJ43_10240 [Streptomyces venezuelae ATCC 10712]
MRIVDIRDSAWVTETSSIARALAHDSASYQVIWDIGTFPQRGKMTASRRSQRRAVVVPRGACPFIHSRAQEPNVRCMRLGSIQRPVRIAASWALPQSSAVFFVGNPDAVPLVPSGFL